MANSIYPKAKERFLRGDLNLMADTIMVAFVDLADYQYSAGHEYFADASAAVIGTPQTLSGKSVTNGVFDAADTVFETLAGDPAEAMILYKDTGVPASSPLIAYIDRDAADAPFQVVPNGGSWQVEWDNTGKGILQL